MFHMSLGNLRWGPWKCGFFELRQLQPWYLLVVIRHRLFKLLHWDLFNEHGRFLLLKMRRGNRRGCSWWNLVISLLELPAWFCFLRGRVELHSLHSWILCKFCRLGQLRKLPKRAIPSDDRGLKLRRLRGGQVLSLCWSFELK